MPIGNADLTRQLCILVLDVNEKKKEKKEEDKKHASIFNVFSLWSFENTKAFPCRWLHSELVKILFAKPETNTIKLPNNCSFHHRKTYS